MNSAVLYLQDSAAILIALALALTIICAAYTYNQLTRNPAPRKLPAPLHKLQSLTISLKAASMASASTQTVEKRNGLLTPPASPPLPHQTNSAYSAFLTSSLPEELSDSPPELQQDVLFGDMDYALWAEIFGHTVSSSSVGSSFASISSLDLDEEAFWEQ
jgi:hypothetical protein